MTSPLPRKKRQKRLLRKCNSNNKRRKSSCSSFFLFWWSVRDSEPKRARLSQSIFAFSYARSAKCKYFYILPDSNDKLHERNSKRVCDAHPLAISLVERTGFEPVTPTLPVLCAPNCANAPPFNTIILSYFRANVKCFLLVYEKSC